jgi:hypothetical protein
MLLLFSSFRIQMPSNWPTIIWLIRKETLEVFPSPIKKAYDFSRFFFFFFVQIKKPMIRSLN